MKNIKFTMNLVWHNCLEFPPEESYNGCLFVTDGINVFPTSYYGRLGWLDLINESYLDVGSNYYWADIEQTVWEDERFRTKC